MAKRNRDDFTESTKLQIAKQAGWLCSDPSCRRPTIGSNSVGDGVINDGVAAHICAAAPGGPRYDPNQTPAQRKSADNGIWLCSKHSKIIDTKDPLYTVKLLRDWKYQAQRYSWNQVVNNINPQAATVRTPNESELGNLLRDAAAADLDVFRRSSKWPSTVIPLSCKVEGLRDPVSTPALATALTNIDDLILVAPPGMGKTTTLFQIADAMLANGKATPIIIPLGDWSTDGAPLLEYILKRPAFQLLTEDNFRTVMAEVDPIGWTPIGLN